MCIEVHRLCLYIHLNKPQHLKFIYVEVIGFYGSSVEMPRPRLPEAPQRQSPRGPPSLRTSSSDSDHQHPRPRTERNPKPSEGRSVRSAQSDTFNPKKLGARIANLESQLDLAQDELRSLKDQLVSTESAKKAAQDQPDRKTKNQTEEKQYSLTNDPTEDKALSKGEEKSSVIVTYETSDDDNNATQRETDVFEVPVEKLADEPKSTNEAESALFNELALRIDEINSLKADLVEKDKEVEVHRQENERLKSQFNERTLKASSAEAEIEELTLRFANISHELEKSKTDLLEKDEKFELSEKAKMELEKDMNRLRVQSEQWRKAADAAASVLSGGMEMNGQRLSERCGSMDKAYTNSFEGVSRYVGSPRLGGDGDDVLGGDKKKSSAGIRMLGELWRKKGQK